MMTKDTSGPAFPCEQHECQDNTWNQTFESGMSLRDYFAAKAMQGLLANTESCFTPSKDEKEAGITWAEKLANECYEIADAMLKDRHSG